MALTRQLTPVRLGGEPARIGESVLRDSQPATAKAVEVSSSFWDNGPMDQHFVPRFYLRAFLDPAVPDGQEPWIWVADLKEQVVERRAPKNLGRAANYYEVPGVQDASGTTVEGLFSKTESAAAPVINKLLRGERVLGEREREDLFCFMAFLVTRVPFFRDLMERMAGNVHKSVLKVVASQSDYFAWAVRKAHKNKRTFTSEEIEKTRQWTLDEKNYTVHGSPAFSLGMGLEMAMDVVYPLFRQMRWAVLRCADGRCFITSDCPIAWVDPTPRPAFLAGHGLLMPNVEVTFPLGPGLCLLGTWDGREGSFEVREKIVAEFNRRRVAFAERYAFASSEAGAMMALEAGRQIRENRG